MRTTPIHHAAIADQQPSPTPTIIYTLDAAAALLPVNVSHTTNCINQLWDQGKGGAGRETDNAEILDESKR